MLCLKRHIEIPAVAALKWAVSGWAVNLNQTECAAKNAPPHEHNHSQHLRSALLSFKGMYSSILRITSWGSFSI